ncbi:MAG: FAD-dependent oxidoreductase [Polyangiaceae bacterium]
MSSVERAHVVVLGAGYAGVLAALRVAGRAGPRARVTLVNDKPHFVERIRLHQRATGQVLPHRLLANMVRGRDIELVVDRATRIDTQTQSVELASGASVAFDYLVYALGSGQSVTSIPGAREHAFGVGTEEQADALAAKLATLPAGAAVIVVGGGLTGIETASEIAEQRADLAVSLVSAGPIALGLSERGQAYVVGVLRELGVAVRAETVVERVTERGLELAGGVEERAACVIVCGGLGPSRLAVESALTVTPGGRLAIDETLRALAHPRIFGAGDGAAIVHREAAFVRMACASAMPLGAHAADNIVSELRGEPVSSFRFGFLGQCISLGRKRGILHYVAPDDTPVDSMRTGWLGARLKEAVCKYTTISLAIERLLPGTYTWSKRELFSVRAAHELVA